MSTRRGRPPRLSREAILRCALEQLDRGRPLTMTGVARALGVAPMTLYTHVRNREDLEESLAALVMDSLELQLDSNAPWHRQARQWAAQLHQRLMQYPQVVQLLGSGGRTRLPRAWMPVHAVLIRCLQAGGLRNRALADAARWVAQTVIAAVMLHHARARETDPEAQDATAAAALLPELSTEDQASFNAILPYLDAPPARLWEFSLDRLEAALIQLAEQGSRDLR